MLSLKQVRTTRLRGKGRLHAALLALGVPLLACLPNPLQNAQANGDTRSLNMFNGHNNERINITYKRDGRYDPQALKQLNWFLRDWRKNEAIEMDPRVIDLVWEVQRELGAPGAIHLICGYRSPATNGMLRARSSGVAEHSQHTMGKAMDFYIPGVPLSRLREAGMLRQRGGVGFYPTSGSPFVHLDVGNVRAWPRMSTDQLARIFPSGETLHLPSDGPPLERYTVALAKLGRDGKSGPEAQDRGEQILAYADTDTRQRGLLSDMFEEAQQQPPVRAPLAVAALAPGALPSLVASLPRGMKPVPLLRPQLADTALVAVLEPNLKPVPPAQPMGIAALRGTQALASLMKSGALPKPQLTALKFDKKSTAGFLKTALAERPATLTAPDFATLGHVEADAGIPRSFGPRAWIMKRGFNGASIRLAMN